jgi:hypothetical protein
MEFGWRSRTRTCSLYRLDGGGPPLFRCAGMRFGDAPPIMGDSAELGHGRLTRGRPRVRGWRKASCAFHLRRCVPRPAGWADTAPKGIGIRWRPGASIEPRDMPAAKRGDVGRCGRRDAPAPIANAATVIGLVGGQDPRPVLRAPLAFTQRHGRLRLAHGGQGDD